MDPITMFTAAAQGAGTLMSLMGGISATAAARQAASVERNIAGFEQQINVQKNQQMQLIARRNQRENIRVAQRARALAVTNATGQGAQFGSGLQGGYGQIEGQTTENAVGLNQNLMIGQNIFGINNQISDAKMQLADLRGQAATAQGISTLGNTLVKIGPTLGNLYGFGKASFGGGQTSSAFGGAEGV